MFSNLASIGRSARCNTIGFVFQRKRSLLQYHLDDFHQFQSQFVHTRCRTTCKERTDSSCTVATIAAHWSEQPPHSCCRFNSHLSLKLAPLLLLRSLHHHKHD